MIKPLAKSVLITLRLTAAASAADAGDAAAVNLKKKSWDQVIIIMQQH